jgi:hypothetical protein
MKAPDGYLDAPGGTVSQSSPITPLASSQVNHDSISIELLEPNAMPPMVRVVWPPQASLIDPKAFPDTAGAIAQLFARAHIVLAAIRAERRL